MIRQIISKFTRHHWDLAFVEPKNGDWLSGDWNYSFVKYSHKEQWFADPFILEVTDKTIDLLVEEFTYTRKVGRIAKLTIDRETMRLVDCNIILELPTHLSFPAILKIDGDIYIYPENSVSGELRLYRYDVDSGEVKLVSTLVEAPLTDAILVTNFKEPFILSTDTYDMQGNGRKLCIYTSDTALGKYEKCDEVTFDANVARGAGCLFENNGMIIRPAQIFEEDNYGAGLSFQEIIKDEKGMSFREINRVYPPKYYMGMHTFNMYKGIAVVDCCVSNHPMISPIIKKLSEKTHQWLNK